MKTPKSKEGGKRAGHVTHCAAVPEGVLLYTKPQMAAMLQVSIRCLDEMMRAGLVSYLKIGERLVRFRASHVLRRLKETSLVCTGTQGTERTEGGGQRTKSQSAVRDAQHDTRDARAPRETDERGGRMGPKGPTADGR